jgi:putative ABC transport system ATP-binding protein
VMVTHDARSASIADRILFLADGNIVRELPRSEPAAVITAMEEISRT